MATGTTEGWIWMALHTQTFPTGMTEGTCRGMVNGLGAWMVGRAGNLGGGRNTGGTEQSDGGGPGRYTVCGPDETYPPEDGTYTDEAGPVT